MRSTPLQSLLVDLRAEGDALRELIVGLDDESWHRTTAAGWAIATQIAHLAWTDEAATHAVRSLAPDGNQEWLDALRLAQEDPQGFVDAGAHKLAKDAPRPLLARWDQSRMAVDHALPRADPDVRIPWFGPPMSARSMATARFMETWAHSPTSMTPSASTWKSATVSFMWRIWGSGPATSRFTNRGLRPPADEFFVSLQAPGGETWTWSRAEPTRMNGCASPSASPVLPAADAHAN